MFSDTVIIRKATPMASIPFRVARRILKKDSISPVVLCNSLPKSGTHLLKNILCQMPGVVDYKQTLATTPSFTFREREEKAIVSKLKRCAPKELVASHIHFGEEISRFLSEEGCLNFFIYRDPRAVFWSEYCYLMTMNKWHRASRFLRKLSSRRQRMDFMIDGGGQFGAEWWPDFPGRVLPYAGWLTSESVFAVRYESLTDLDRKERAIGDIVTYLERSGSWLSEFSSDVLLERAIMGTSKHSHTFRKGSANEWHASLEPAELRRLEGKVASHQRMMEFMC